MRAGAAIIGLVGIGVAACGSGTSSSSSAAASASSPAAAGASLSVTVRDFSFDAVAGSLAPSTQATVGVVNVGNAEHSFSVNGGGPSVDAQPGTTAHLQLTAPSSGSILFHCRFHPQMHGSIRVGSGGGTAPTPSVAPSQPQGYGSGY